MSEFIGLIVFVVIVFLLLWRKFGLRYIFGMHTHEWDKWSQPEFKERFPECHVLDRHPRPRYQHRYCKTCGTYQEKSVD